MPELQTCDNDNERRFYYRDLGWGKHTKEGYEKAKEFLGYAKIIQLNNKIAELSIELRRKGKIKLPDI